MRNDDFLPRDFSIGTFRPVSVHFRASDHISFILADASTTTGYVGQTFFQPVYDNKADALVGFNLECAKYLRGKLQNPLMPLLLLRARRYDLGPNAKLSVPREDMEELYRKAFRLMWSHPRTWIVR